MGEIILCGAGCLKADWLTVAACQAIEKADCILYDDLLDPAVLDLNSRAEKIYVGKRKDRPSISQEKIQARLLECAALYPCTLRLKGGDPFVFGRGYEEARFLNENGIPCQIIPGISSCIAIPEACGIPVTCRDYASAFAVLSAHGKKDQASLESLLQPIRTFQGTLIILMGLSRANQIQNQLLEWGWSKNLPAAVCWTDEYRKPHCLRADLSHLQELAAKAHSPAVLVIGPTAALNAFPASRRKVLLTGSQRSNQKLARLLEPEVECIPVQQLQIIPRPLSLKPALKQSPTWIILASSHGADLFFDRMKEERIDFRQLAGVKFACVGKTTADALARHGFQADLISPLQTLADLADQLVPVLRPEDQILSLRCSSGSQNLEKRLEQHAFVQRLDLYDSQAIQLCEPDPRSPLVFMSAQGVSSFFACHDKDERTIYSMGPSISRALEKEGIKKVIQCPWPDLTSLAGCIKE